MAETSKLITNGAAVVTILLTGWNAYVAHQNNERAAEFERYKIKVDENRSQLDENARKVELALKQASHNFARYEFVQKLMPDLLSTERSRQLLGVNLVKIVLDEQDARVLLEGLAAGSTQAATQLKEVAVENSQAVISAKQARLDELVKALDGDDRDARLRAAGRLQRDFKGDPEAVIALLKPLRSGGLENLGQNGRINVLYTLNATSAEAWSGPSIAAAEEVIEALERRESGLGTQARGVLADLKGKLRALRSRPT